MPLASYGFFRAAAVALALSKVNYWMIAPMLLSILYIAYVLHDQSRPLLMTIR